MVQRLAAVICIAVHLALSNGPATAQSPSTATTEPTAQQRGDALLAAMGGASVWRRIVGARIAATHYSATIAGPYRNVIWNDFTRFRVHIDARNADLVSVRGYDGDRALRDNGRGIAPVPASFVEQERRWWHTNVYRTLHRLASADPRLAVRLLAPDRLAVLEDGERLIAWFKLNVAGEPVLFGTEADAPGTLFGPLDTHVSGARFPRWGGAPDGSWRYEVLDAEFTTQPPTMPPLPGS
jgi:hypothetical protein